MRKNNARMNEKKKTKKIKQEAKNYTQALGELKCPYAKKK